MIPLTWLVRWAAKKLRLLPVFLTFLTLTTLSAHAQTVVNRYVNTDCANNGDGTVASPCASGAGLTGPYNKLSNAEPDIQTDYSNSLVTANVQVNVILAGNTEDTPSVTWGGTTMDATRYVHIYTDPTWRHAGAWDDAKYILKADNGSTAALWITDDYVRVTGLQIKVGPNTFAADGIRIGNGSGNGDEARITQNLIRHDTSGCINSNCNGATGIHATLDLVNPRIWNNVIIGFNYDSTANCLRARTTTSGEVYLSNNTLRTCGRGIWAEFAGFVLAKNNIIDNSTTCVSGTLDAASDYNAGSCAGMTGSNSRSSQTFTFVDSANFNLKLAAGDAGAKDFGTNLSGDANLPFSTDIEGVTRSGTWDIGADEYVNPCVPRRAEEICGNGFDDACSGYTEGACPGGWMNASNNDGCDLACPGTDADWDGYPASQDCNDNDRWIFPGTQRACGTDGTQTCQSSGSWSTCAEGELCEATGSGDCFYINPSTGSDSNNGQTRATAWATPANFTTYLNSPDRPVGWRQPVAGDVYYFMGGNHTWSYLTGRLCGSPTRCSKFLTIHGYDGTASNPILFKGYPGVRPRIAPVITTEQTAVIYAEGVNYTKFSNLEIDGTDQTGKNGLQVVDSTNTEIFNVWVHDIAGIRDNLGGFYISSVLDFNIHNNASYDNEGNDGVGAGDNQMSLFRGSGDMKYNYWYNTRALDATTPQCFKQKHADYASTLNYIGNIHHDCGENGDDAVGFAGGNLNIRNNLFMDMRRTKWADLGGNSYQYNISISNNTWKNITGQPIAIIPQQRYNTDQSTSADMCSGTGVIGPFTFTKNVVQFSGANDVFNISQFGPDGIRAAFFDGDFNSNNNHFSNTTQYTFCAFCSNNADTSCSDSARGSLGQTYANLAAWQAFGYDTTSTASTITFNQYQSSATIDAAGRGWLNGITVDGSSGGTLSSSGSVRGKTPPLGHFTR